LASKSNRRPNPFYVLLMVVSTAFVVTIFGYLIAPTVLSQAETPENSAPKADLPNKGAGPDQSEPNARHQGTLALADWLSRQAPMVLTIELVVMAVTAVLAMTTDHWFQSS